MKPDKMNRTFSILVLFVFLTTLYAQEESQPDTES